MDIKTIEIETPNLTGYIRVKAFEDFSSVVDLAGHFVNKIEEDKLVENFLDFASDYFYDYVVKNYDLNELADNELGPNELINIINILLSSIDMPEEVQPYEQEGYINLNGTTNTKIYYFNENTQDYTDLCSKLLNQHKQELDNSIKTNIEVMKEANELKEKQAKARQVLLEGCKLDYNNATTATKKKEIAAALKIKLSREYGEKLSNDEVIYELEN